MKRPIRSCLSHRRLGASALAAVLLGGCSTDGADTLDVRDPGDVSDATDALGTDVDALDAADGSPALARTIDPTLTPADLELVPGPPPPDVELPEGVRVRVASYNIFAARLASAEAIGSMLGALDVDWVGLQECPADVARVIAESGGFEHVAGDGTVLLSRTPLIDPVSSSLAGSGRILLRAETIVRGARFSVYNAHIDWDVAGDRQARALVDEHIALDGNPYLVMTGDFNDEHYSSQNTILEEVLADVWSTLGWFPGERISWPSNQFDDTEGSQLIDLIFVPKAPSPIVVAGDVINLHPVLSDHKPVVAELLFPAPGSPPFATDPFAASRSLWRDFPTEAELPPNLLANPGAEEGTDAWTIEGGGVSTARRRSSEPRSGEAMFAGAPGSTPVGAPWSSGTQSVDLEAWAELIDEGRGVLYALAWMRTSFDTESSPPFESNIVTPTDSGEVVVTMYDGDGTLSGRTSSGHRDTLRYHPYLETIPVPAGTRSARYTWLAHNRLGSAGPGNDAVFDDLYLGLAAVPDGEFRTGNLLAAPGAEPEESAVAGRWSAEGWSALPDLVPHGLAFFPPWSRAGRGFYFGGGRLDFDGGRPSATLAQVVPLDAWFDAIDRGEVDVRWGGWLRTYRAKTYVGMSLEILDGDGVTRLTLDGDEVWAAEWTRAVHLSHLPPGASALRIVLRADVSAIGSGVFADDLFVALVAHPDSD